MNRSFLIVLIPAILVGTAYFLLSTYAGVKLAYPRMIGAAVALGVAVYLVHCYTRRKPGRARADRMVITEIFRSIQGEGTRAGLPCIFVTADGLQPALRVV